MPNFTTANITQQGDLSITAAVGGTPLVITRVAVGSGVTGGDPTALTDLVSSKMNLIPIPPQVSSNIVAPDEVNILATLDSANAPISPFNLTEIGVYAKSGTGPELLIAYYQCSVPGDTISQQTGLSRLQIFFSLPIFVGLTANVTITVVAGNAVFVPPVVAGNGITVTAPTDSHGNITSWIVSTSKITVNTTLFVAAGNNDVAPNFSTIQKALDYLGSYSLPSNVSITISVAAGSYIGPTIQVFHLNGTRISIVGKQNPDVSYTGIGAITGSARNFLVPLLGVSNTANIVVGNWINLWNPGGTNANYSNALLAGMFQVTAISGNTVTIRVPYKGAGMGIAGATAGSFTPLSTYIVAAPGNFGFSIGPAGIGGIYNIGILPQAPLVPGNYLHGIYCVGPFYLFAVGVANFYAPVTSYCYGFIFSNGPAVGTLVKCCATGCDCGLVTSAAANANICWCGFTHNWNMGTYSEDQGVVVVPPWNNGDSYSFIAGNVNYGSLASNGSYFVIGGITVANGSTINGHVICSFNNVGLILANMSHSASSDGSCIYYATSNTVFDVEVTGFAINNMFIGGSRIFSQAATVLTAAGIING